MDFEFHCPECGELINQEDSSEKIARLQKNIILTEKELEKLRTQRYARRKAIRKEKKEVKTRKKTAKKKKPATKKKSSSKKRTAKKTSTKKVKKKKTVKKK